MPVKRRGQVTRAEIVLANWQQEELGGFGGRRQPSMGGTSRVTGDGHARICEGLGVKVPGATRPNSPSVNMYMPETPGNELFLSIASSSFVLAVSSSTMASGRSISISSVWETSFFGLFPDLVGQWTDLFGLISERKQ
jgi:hypothetical protein